jgi:preprotein translocase subunit SecG
MLYNFLLVLLIIDSVLLVGAILAQSGKGTGLAASFGGASSSPDAFIGIRQAGNLLTKFSWWGGGVFLFLAFVLQLMSSHAGTPRSVLEKPLTTQTQTAPVPTSTPAVPLQNAPTSNTVVPLKPAPATAPPAKTPPPGTPKR